MITWTKITDDNWLVRWDGKAKNFDCQEKVIVWTFHILRNKDESRDDENIWNDIETAMVELIRNDDNYVEFGIFGTFIYSDRIGYETRSEIRNSN